MNRIKSSLFLLLQMLLPRKLLTAAVYRLAQMRTVALKDFFIDRFVRVYKVNVDEIKLPVPSGFSCFNEFFTRELKSGERPIDSTADALISPADGTVSAAGRIESERLFQAKGLHYTLQDLLATDIGDADKYRNGSFATIYLAPYNYHRVHAPFAGKLVAARYVPGDLYSVNATTVSLLRKLFVRNERLICHFETALGPMIAILVGALNVGSITTPWTGEIRPRKKGVVEDIDIRAAGVSTTVEKGDLLGWFNMGSTVILLAPPGVPAAFAAIEGGKKVRVGQAIGSAAPHIK